jgi:transposase-like protein
MSETKRVSYSLPLERRHEIILAALTPGANLSKIARDYGIHRNTLYEYLEVALDKPEQRMHDAEAEAAFRRKVWELVR